MIEFIHEVREWTAFCVEVAILIVIIMEYQYDKSKDLEKKHKKTRTTKKTTNKAGESIVEETSEVSEPVQENKNG